MVDIFDEVSEDLRAERAQALLKRYGYLLIVLAVAVIAGVAGWQGWTWQLRKSANRVGAEYIAAMRQATPPTAAGITPEAADKAADAFADVAASAPDGYRTLARLREAALRDTAGDRRGALALWDKVSADTSADPLLRGLADLLWVQHQVDAGDPAAVEGRIAPLIAPGNAWRALALESQAWLAIRTGQTEKARGILTGLQTDTAAPDGVRARASGLLTQIGQAADPAQTPASAPATTPAAPAAIDPTPAPAPAAPATPAAPTPASPAPEAPK